MLRRAMMAAGAAPTVYLDSLATAPIYASSLKKVVSTATVAVRVRRSSDNAEQDIGFSGDALDTASLASFVGSDSAYVVTFYDQTGNGYHMTQATGSKQPRIVNAGVYDGIVRFDGTDDAMSTASVALSQPQMALFIDGVLPTESTTEIFMEASSNWNSNTYSFIFYTNTSRYEAGMNSGTATTQKVNWFALAMTTRKTLALLFDRTLTGTSEIRAWVEGSSITGNAITGYTNDMSGSFATRDQYVGGRAGTSLYSAPQMFTMVMYNADVSSIRTNIEAVIG